MPPFLLKTESSRSVNTCSISTFPDCFSPVFVFDGDTRNHYGCSSNLWSHRSSSPSGPKLHGTSVTDVFDFASCPDLPSISVRWCRGEERSSAQRHNTSYNWMHRWQKQFLPQVDIQSNKQTSHINACSECYRCWLSSFTEAGGWPERMTDLREWKQLCQCVRICGIQVLRNLVRDRRWTAEKQSYLISCGQFEMRSKNVQFHKAPSGLLCCALLTTRGHKELNSWKHLLLHFRVQLVVLPQDLCSKSTNIHYTLPDTYWETRDKLDPPNCTFGRPTLRLECQIRSYRASIWGCAQFESNRLNVKPHLQHKA